MCNMSFSSLNIFYYKRCNVVFIKLEILPYAATKNAAVKILVQTQFYWVLKSGIKFGKEVDFLNIDSKGDKKMNREKNLSIN
ncbi:hypothetical protein BpHYR1_042008 [Brachionus plicatilis]|uniref:Uncharacterized protein n=1 Tax=Brachionus plicatilis TaxID=10195 RepID=A0A3M7PMM5_BRAPC|nr:hypothetical protein BpHYR1_042008 [Brachionus plicatilis]